MKAHWFYYVLKYSGYIGHRLFFGRMEVIGKEKLPTDGTIILAPNHQGAFMDAYLAGIRLQNPIYFLTRADIFKKRTIPILKSMNMMPIYRIRDGIQSLNQNDQVFETCFKLLSEERNLLIFPEANHNADHYLRPLSKGSARLALDARKALDPAQKLYVLPTGLNYFSHRRPLAKFILCYGDPIDLNQYMPLYEEHKQKAYNKFKEDLEVAMKATLILPEKDEHYEQKKAWLFQPKHEHLSFHELKKMGESNHFEERKITERGVLKKGLIGLFSLFNLPPLLGLKKILSGIKDRAFDISIKYLVGSLFHILWWSLLFAVGVIWLSWPAGFLFAGMAIVAAYARQSLIKF